MSEQDKFKSTIVSMLHLLHDDMLGSLMKLEQLLKVFGEDMSWYEDWRKDRMEAKKHD
jgi:hypothetical protein